jgi:ABC-type uncharacterized transport system permease subunit
VWGGEGMLATEKAKLANYIKLEKRAKVSKVSFVVIPLISIVLALLVGGVYLWIMGYSPARIYTLMFMGSFGSFYSFSETIVKAIPLMLTGLAVTLAFRMSLWNIGAEGQLYMGAFMAGGVALFFPEMPAPIMIFLMLVAGFIGGAFWGFIPGALRALAGVNETITTLMLNYVATLWVGYLVYGPWKEPGGFMPFTEGFKDYAILPTIPGTRIHAGLYFAIIIAIIMYIIFKRTTWGYQIGVIGESQRVANYAGMNIKRNIILVMLISGGVAGIAGMAEVSGIIGRLQYSISPGYGYTAIIIAWLSRLNPFVIILVSIFFGGLLNGGYALQIVGLPAVMVSMLQGAILFFVLGGEMFTRYRIKFGRGGRI